MGGCGIFRKCRWLPYFAITGGKLCASNLIESTTMGAGKTKRGSAENGTNNLSVQGQTDFANIVKVES